MRTISIARLKRLRLKGFKARLAKLRLKRLASAPARLARRAASAPAMCFACRKPISVKGKVSEVSIRCAQCLRCFCRQCSMAHFGFFEGRPRRRKG